ncbi:unnamed protein product, partial [Arctogadus glacialis]
FEAPSDQARPQEMKLTSGRLRRRVTKVPPGWVLSDTFGHASSDDSSFPNALRPDTPLWADGIHSVFLAQRVAPEHLLQSQLSLVGGPAVSLKGTTSGLVLKRHRSSFMPKRLCGSKDAGTSSTPVLYLQTCSSLMDIWPTNFSSRSPMCTSCRNSTFGAFNTLLSRPISSQAIQAGGKIGSLEHGHAAEQLPSLPHQFLQPPPPETT